MWPAYTAGLLAIAITAVGLVLAVAGAKRSALACAAAVALFAVAGVAMYAVAEARYQSCQDHRTQLSLKYCELRVLGDTEHSLRLN